METRTGDTNTGDTNTGFAWGRDELRRVAVLENQDEALRSAELAVVLGAIQRAKQHALSLFREGFQRAASQDSKASAPAGMRTPAVLLKPVGDLCNLRCTYCYEGAGPERVEDSRMTEATLTAITRDVLAQGKGSVQFLWHGGEPLMAGLSFFQRGLELQREYNVNQCQIVNTVQTNGLLLNEAWLRFFRQHNFNVGISVDGPQHVHDHFRIDACGRGTYGGVAKAVKTLQDYGFDVGAISVISPALSKQAPALFATFQSLGIHAFDVHPNFGTATRPESEPLHPKAFSDFVVELFDLWLASGDTRIRVRIFDDIFQGLIGHAPSTCYFAGTCTSILGFEANGDAIPCTRPFDRDLYTFGNIGRDSLVAIQQSKSFQLFSREDRAAQTNTENCRWHGICHNGCPQHRQTNGQQSVSGANLYCQCQSGIEGGYASIFDHAARRSEEVLGLR
jgi:uncharacterized protein